jgi:hypothetical protein
MNPNDILAQQQALLNQAMQNTHQLVWVYGVLFLALAIIHFTIVYLFYARLRDIADELRKLRIAYEMADDRRQPSGSLRKPTPDSPGNPFQEGGVSQG